jgi:hypothetical protein
MLGKDWYGGGIGGPDIAKDLYLSKEMDWDYTMVEETFEYYMHQNFEQD